MMTYWTSSFRAHFLVFIALFLINGAVSAATITMPSTLVSDTTNYVLLSSSGTTPSVSGFSSSLRVTVSVTSGTLKITQTTGLTAPTGFTTAQWSSGAGEIAFEGTQVDVNNALATLQYQGGSAGVATLTASATPTGAAYFSGNGHYYEAVTTGTDITWTDAKNAAAARTFNGLTGYLATVTSAAEQGFVESKSSGTDAWLGANDEATNNTWKWVTGPEAGTHFFTQTSGRPIPPGHGGGTAVGGSYTNWDTNLTGCGAGCTFDEPNGQYSGSNLGTENYLEVKANGKWNDLKDTQPGIRKYVVEYGGLPGETATVQANTTLTLISTQNPPELISSNPADNATGVVLNSTITLTFSEAVTAQSGNLTIYRSADDSVVEAIPLSGGNVQGAGTTTLTITPSSLLAASTAYYIKIDATALKDTGGQAFAGIADKTTLNFTTGNSVPNPLDDPNVVSGIKAQANISARFMQRTTYAVLDRMEWLRRHRGDSKLSHQGLRFTSSNPGVNRLAGMLPYSDYLSNAADTLLPQGWSVWTAGTVTVGDVGGNSSRDIKSKGISFGMDKEINDRTIMGAAIRFGHDDLDTAGQGSSVSSDAYSISVYGSYAHNEDMFIDAVIGASRLDFDLVRQHTTGTLTGSRHGNQIFGSVVFRTKMDQGGVSLSPYGRVDLGYTRLSAYRESGTSAALSYKQQNIQHAEISAGLLADYRVVIPGGIFKPHGRIEYGADVSPSSDAVVYYTSAPGTDYKLSVDAQSFSNIRGGVGFDLDMDSGLSLKMDYERNQSADSWHTDTFSLEAAYLATSNTRYTLTFGNGADSKPRLGLGAVFEMDGGWSLSTSYEAVQTSNASIGNNFVMKAMFPF